jgi:hypothetical protein
MKDETFYTENGEFAVSARKLDTVVSLDFRTEPRMEFVDGYETLKAGTGYGSFHFQLSPADARKLGMQLLEEGNKDYVPEANRE